MKYKVIYNNNHIFDDTFDSESAALDFAFNRAEETILQNLKDIIKCEMDDMYEIVEVQE